jgi:phosphoglycolate phosphatase-like HAD superfamily hydrolase
MSQVTVIDIIALIFDFDDTLVPDSLTALLQQHGIDPSDFWQVKAKNLIQKGYDPPAAYLKLILDNIGDGKPLGNLTNEKLREFGATLDKHFYPGLPEFFDEVRAEIKETEIENIKVEFYIISGGLQPILEGSKIVKEYFEAAYGCQLAGDTEDGVLKYVKRSVSFTEKTRYLFEINKGVKQSDSKKNPYLVNAHVENQDRRVPFTNMIYVGDGLTDIPCFSLVSLFKGRAFGVFDPEKKDKAKDALEKFLIPNRVIGMHAPRYAKNHELGSLLRVAAGKVAVDIQLERSAAIKTSNRQ